MKNSYATKKKHLESLHDIVVLDALDEGYDRLNTIQAYTQLSDEDLKNAIARLSNYFGLKAQPIIGNIEDEIDWRYFLAKI